MLADFPLPLTAVRHGALGLAVPHLQTSKLNEKKLYQYPTAYRRKENYGKIIQEKYNNYL